MTTQNDILKQIPDTFYFSELIGKKIILGGKKIGRLSDVIIVETASYPEVTHFFITRSFGYPSLLVPWGNIYKIMSDRIEISIEDIGSYEGEPKEGDLLLKNYVLDKKVIDLEDHEIEVVYDIRLVKKTNKLLVFEADISRFGLLRRLGLKGLASFLHSIGRDIDDLSIPWTYIQPLPTTISRFRGDVKLRVLKEKLEMMHPVDIADILEDMDPEQRVMIFTELDTSKASDTLEEIDPPIQREIISSLKIDHVINLINEMTPGQTADILTAISHNEAEEILDLINPEKAKKVKSILDRSEEVIENYSTSKFIMLNPEMKVGDVQEEYPRLAKGKDVIMYIYVADNSKILEGVVDIKELLQANDEEKLIDIMVDDVITLTPDSTLKEASELFARYDFRALPVINSEKRLIGVIPYRDVMKLRHHFLD